jgi:hypothetical protein
MSTSQSINRIQRVRPFCVFHANECLLKGDTNCFPWWSTSFEDPLLTELKALETGGLLSRLARYPRCPNPLLYMCMCPFSEGASVCRGC